MLNGLVNEGKCPQPFLASKSGCPVMSITLVGSDLDFM